MLGRCAVTVRAFRAWRRRHRASLGGARRLAALQVLLQHLQAGGLLTVVGDDGARAADHLAGLALGVDLAQLRGGTGEAGTGECDGPERGKVKA